MKRKFLFPWICKKTGGFFFAEGWPPVRVCPICGVDKEDIQADSDAFESGHLSRKWAESFFDDERRKQS